MRRKFLHAGHCEKNDKLFAVHNLTGNQLPSEKN